ncbi:Cystinosin [Tolypocladium capitatum]|uniref:Cystinosin n=1 Tax=Tolypocladium capitatum TaxID=45235 RepID=A0A2K3QQA7_9HYPO|nr:Cystinosin [Tolypocladium capitatum]
MCSPTSITALIPRYPSPARRTGRLATGGRGRPSGALAGGGDVRLFPPSRVPGTKARRLTHPTPNPLRCNPRRARRPLPSPSATIALGSPPASSAVQRSEATAGAAMAFLPFLSALFGWVYTFCWSASFYPQPLLNFSRRSTSGTTVDFPLINVLGFAAYFVSNLAFYYSPVVRAQYAARNRGLTPTVQFNDITFALHALVLSLVTVSQYLARPAWGFSPSAATRPSRFVLGIAAACVLGVLATYARAASSPTADPVTDWCELDVVYAVGYVKLVITLVKYTPQIAANWRNKSTQGWSIWQVLLDLAGGLLSVAQQGIDSWLQRDWSGVTGNPVKFALGNASMVYDSVFMWQHYVLYRGPGEGKAAGGEEDPLLGDEADEESQRRRLD